MNSRVIKRSVVIAGRRTSISLEDAFWKALKEIAISRHITPSRLVTLVDAAREQMNLSSCLRLFVLDFYRDGSGRLIGDPSARKPSSNSGPQIQENQERLVARRCR
ncbi:MAG TPA: ribbon-helix-helix domain-containing protein [Xanthobacteraceae bacterium]